MSSPSVSRGSKGGEYDNTALVSLIMTLRAQKAAQMGFTRCVLPARNIPDEAGENGIRLMGVNSLEQALERLVE